MDEGLITIALAFFEGFALIISPCILPILPIILSGSLSGSRARPFGIIIGFVLMFTIVTLFTRFLLQYAHISFDMLRNFSYVILILLGVIMCSSYLTEKFTVMTQRLMNVGSQNSVINNPESGWLGGIIFGGLIGIVWTPCAGPILAAVIVQSVIQTTTLGSILIVGAFALGAGTPMLIIALAGREIMKKFNFFRAHSVFTRKLLGVIIIASVIFLYYYETLTLFYSQSASANTLPTGIENGIEKPFPAPQLAPNSTWINSPPLTWQELKGKVVLIDFWTYSCINCIRTLPYLKDWYAKYHDKGLVIIGVHSPEFDFEKNIDNVKNAVLADGIHYPVVLDNDYVTWNNFQNRYWPAHYLVNKDGQVVYEHFGEGEYDVTENNIRYLLGLTNTGMTHLPEEQFSSYTTPETYVGSNRAENFANTEIATLNQPNKYNYPEVLNVNQWALQGNWTIYGDKIVANTAFSAIKLHFYAGKVFCVMGKVTSPVTVRVTINGQAVEKTGGADVKMSQITVSQHKLYSIIQLEKEGDGIVELTALNPGLEIYAFTFGT